MDWLKELMKGLRDEKWSVNAMVSVMIDNCLSFGDLNRFRQALTLDYSRNHDRYMHPVWVTPDMDANLGRPRLIRTPEPVPPIHFIKEEFRKYQSELKVEVSEDGKVASHSFREKVIELHEQHEAAGMLPEGCGTSKEHKHRIVYSFDAFPCKGVSIEHAVLFSADLKIESQSEAMCKILLASVIKENNEGLNRMHANRKVDVEFNQIVATGHVVGTRGQQIWVQLLLACDKKAVEMFVGCSPGCAWCECTKDQRLSTAWSAGNRPTTWPQAEALLKKTCTRAFPSIFDIVAAAHLALPFEKLPRRCRFCKEKPYATEEEYRTDLKDYAEKRAETSKEGAAYFQRARATYAGA